MTHDAGGEEGQGPSREVKQEGGSKSPEEEELDGEVRRATGGSSEEEEAEPSQTTSRRKNYFIVSYVIIVNHVCTTCRVLLPRSKEIAVPAGKFIPFTCL